MVPSASTTAGAAGVSVRINVFGASGVGKSTLGSALGAHLGIPHFDTDAYYHFPTDPPFQKQRTPEARCALLEQDLRDTPRWVLSGGASTWWPAPALDYTLHVFLWLPSDLRMDRLLARERKLYGARIAPGGDMADDHAAFMDWARGYDVDDGASEGITLARHEALLREARCPVVRLVGDVSIDEAARRVLTALSTR